MILIILVLICILWIVVTAKNRSLEDVNIIKKNVDGPVEKKLYQIKNTMDRICKEIKIKPDYIWHNSTDKTYVKDKKHIYIVLKKENGEFFDNNTLMNAAIHELTHIICNDTDHGPVFIENEKLIKQTAIKLKFYNDKTSIDHSYPCI